MTICKRVPNQSQSLSLLVHIDGALGGRTIQVALRAETHDERERAEKEVRMDVTMSPAIRLISWLDALRRDI